jgi:hypothetical protein
MLRTDASGGASGGSSGGAPAGTPLDKRILEELVYERVRLSFDMVELAAFEADLMASIDRALSSCASSTDERNALALQYLQSAWERLSQEVEAELASHELRDSGPLFRRRAR